jgi:hypothetical protein
MKDLRRPANVLGRLHSLASTSRFLDFIAAEGNATGQAVGSFKTWFWRPPRPQGAAAATSGVGGEYSQHRQDAHLNVALVLGFGFWWIYFDVVGGRLPKSQGRALADWTLSHYPITLSIAAAGARKISLIGHGHDARTPAATAWLL